MIREDGVLYTDEDIRLVAQDEFNKGIAAERARVRAEIERRMESNYRWGTLLAWLDAEQEGK